MATRNDAPDAGPADRQGIKVIARAAAVLRALEKRPDGMSLGDLARVVDLPRSTVQRIVDALHSEGFVIASSVAHGVRLGPALLALAGATRFHIAHLARQTLEVLAKECGETVDLSIPDQDRMVFIDQVAGSHRLAAVSAVGLFFPMHGSANGKAVLAAMTQAELDKLRRRLELRAVTEHTLTSWPRLERELEAVRREGVAFDREEHSIGICAVAAAIRAPSGELAAISIPVPTQRFVGIERELTQTLRRHVSVLSEKLRL